MFEKRPWHVSALDQVSDVLCFAAQVDQMCRHIRDTFSVNAAFADTETQVRRFIEHLKFNDATGRGTLAFDEVRAPLCGEMPTWHAEFSRAFV